MSTRWRRRAARWFAGAGAVLAIFLVVIAIMPVGWLKSRAEAALTRQTGRPVKIRSMEREDAFSFTPVIRLANIIVPQPAWAGEGELASAALLRVRVNVFSALGERLVQPAPRKGRQALVQSRLRRVGRGL